jgi:hypothetical protein
MTIAVTLIILALIPVVHFVYLAKIAWFVDGAVQAKWLGFEFFTDRDSIVYYMAPNKMQVAFVMEKGRFRVDFTWFRENGNEDLVQIISASLPLWKAPATDEDGLIPHGDPAMKENAKKRWRSVLLEQGWEDREIEIFLVNLIDRNMSWEKAIEWTYREMEEENDTDFE